MVRRWGPILGVAFGLRALVAFVALRTMPMVHDAESYVDFAVSLLADFPGRAAYYWPPGNSLLLALAFAGLGKSIWVARVVMVAVSTAHVVLCTLLAERLCEGRASVRRAAGFIAAAYMPAVMLVAQSYAQHLAALCLVLLAWAALRAIDDKSVAWAALAGAAFGLGCLTRPSMVSVAPVLVIAMASRARREAIWRLVGPSLAFAVVAGAIVLPVARHNAGAGGGWTISTNNERNLFLGNNPHTPNYKTSHLGQRSLEQLDPETRTYLESFYSRPDARMAMREEAIRYMATHPLVTAYRTLNRATSFWGFDYLASRTIQEDKGWGKKGLLALLVLESGAYVLVMGLAIVGMFTGDSEPFVKRWVLALALAYELPYVIAFSGGTYHFPVMGLLIPFAAVALERPSEIWSSVRRSRGTLATLALFAIIQAEYAYHSLRMAS